MAPLAPFARDPRKTEEVPASLAEPSVRFLSGRIAVGNPLPRAILLAFLWLPSASLLSQHPQWLDKYDESKDLALKENRLILVDFWASWCEPCLRMDRLTWSQWPIVVASKEFVCLRLDYDREMNLAVRFEVEVVPTVVILDAFGTKLAHIVGFKTANEMAAILKPLAVSVRPLYSLLKRLEMAPDSVELQVALGDQYHGMLLPEMSNSCYEEFLDNTKPADNPRLEAHALTGMALNYQALGNQDEAEEMLAKCLGLYPDNEYRPMQLYMLTRIYLTQDENEKARNTLELLRKEFPQDKHRSMAEDLFKK